MEGFSLLKYWKSAGAGAKIGISGGSPVSSGSNATTTTIVGAGDFESDIDAEDDEGPFFDLQFAVPEEEDDEEETRKLEERENGEILEEEEEEEEEDEEDDDDEDVGGERELKLRPSLSTSSCENSDANVSLSTSDDLLFKGRIVQIDGEDEEEEVNSKSGQFPVSASLLRSATKFRVFMLKLKRSKSESNTTKSQPEKQNEQQNNKDNTSNDKNKNRKFLTVKFRVEEVPVISLLSRVSSNSKTNTTAAADDSATGEPQTPESGDKKRSKKVVVMEKYLKLVKPLYTPVSKRNQHPPPPAEDSAVKAAETKEDSPEKVKTTEPPPAEKGEMKGQKGLNLKGMIMAKKHLGKSKSAVVHSTMQNVASNRRDDSLLELQDGIQGAILHCKRSFNASAREEEREEVEAALASKRSASDSSHEKKRTSTTTTELTRVDDNRNDVVGV